MLARLQVSRAKVKSFSPRATPHQVLQSSGLPTRELPDEFCELYSLYDVVCSIATVRYLRKHISIIEHSQSNNRDHY